ncbi:Hypothetical protein CINCED_3A021834 [Cinara cedri]|uniref:Uncharacterized protein n=1 Tax=Cinara cedri TaxID=506608 RepID=A0A5E4M3R5_9HEMI|nr:Hypothetical protein CINCED_3A021834 [Cinara cedri]
MSSATLDIQCVLRTDNKYLIKEISIVDTDTWATQHWILRNSQSAQNGKIRNTNKWLKRNFHNIPVEYGDVEYEELDRILNSLKFDHIYVKGEQKQKMIIDFIPQVNVYYLWKPIYIKTLYSLSQERTGRLCACLPLHIT